MKHHLQAKYRFLILVVCLLAILALAANIVYSCYQRYYKVTLITPEFQETADILSNPYQGFYHLYGYRPTEDTTYPGEKLNADIKSCSDTGLALLEINLRDYNDRPLSVTALSQIDHIFHEWGNADKQLIVRFLYDWDGKPLETEPKDISIIKNHMSQVAELVNAHTDTIYLLQGIFVGAVGEMHSSNFLDDDSMKELALHLASVTDPSVYLAVRTPAHWRIITETKTTPDSAAAFTNILTARLGLFNDGMLGSANDLGTYGEASEDEADSLFQKWVRADEIAFQNQLCLYVPNGGEVTLDNPYNDLVPAVNDLTDMHVSYLNAEHHADVLNKWKNSRWCTEDVFYGMNGYDYIKAHLGYRYVFDSLFLHFDSKQDDTALCEINIKNTGFASCYKKLHATLTVYNTDTKTSEQINLPEDFRLFSPNAVHTIRTELPIRTYGIGNYELYVSVTDDTANTQIAFANQLPVTENGYYIGQFSITKEDFSIGPFSFD